MLRAAVLACIGCLHLRGLGAAFAHLVTQGRRAFGDTRFAALHTQDALDGLLGVGRQGGEILMEEALLEIGWDITPTAHEIPDAGLCSAAGHQSFTLAECLCGVLDLLSCGRHGRPSLVLQEDVGYRGRVAGTAQRHLPAGAPGPADAPQLPIHV